MVYLPRCLVVVSCIVFAGAFAACGETHDCPDDPCLPASVRPFVDLHGSLSLSSASLTDHWTFDATATTPCTAEGGGSFVWNSDLHELEVPVDVSCEGQATIRFAMADLRHLEVGTHQVTSDRYDLWISYLNPGEEAACYGYLDPLEYTLVVEEASGGFAAHPEVVTADYRRVVRVELPLSLSSYAGKSWYGGALHDCTLSLSGTLTVHLALTAQDISALPQDRCICE